MLAAGLTGLLRPFGIEIQALTTMFVYAGFLCAELYTQPFRTKLLGYMEIVAMLVYLVTVYLAIFMSQDRMDDHGKEALGILIVVVNITALVGVLWVLSRELYPRLRSILWTCAPGQELTAAAPWPPPDKEVVEIELKGDEQQAREINPISVVPVASGAAMELVEDEETSRVGREAPPGPPASGNQQTERGRNAVWTIEL